MPLTPGQVLNNRYRIVNLLGQDGMGSVYKVWDLNLKRPRALKENFDSSADAQQQFMREAQILADLTHPNLPEVIDQFIIPGQGQYLVMQYVEGRDLQEMLDEKTSPGGLNSRLPEAEVIPWMIQICSALSYLHEQQPQIIHRDIKPGNIQITPQGKAVLVDFGITKIAGKSKNTLSGAKAATPGYSPPEQMLRQPTDARSDIYALGATLYHLLTGQALVNALQRQPYDPLVRPETVNPAISPPAAIAIWRAMHMDPAARFQSAHEFSAALATSPTPRIAKKKASIHPSIGGDFPGGLSQLLYWPGSYGWVGWFHHPVYYHPASRPVPQNYRPAK